MLLTRPRTHRERKEQYIKALEIELSRLREGYTSDVAQMNMMLREHQEENAFLKELLTSRGISFQRELEKRNATKPRSGTYGSGTTMPQPAMYNPMTSAPSSAGYSPQSTLPDRPYVAGSISGGSVSAGTQHSYSPADPGMFEQSIKHESPGVPETPGVFERDPQLQVEFILAYVHPLRSRGTADQHSVLRQRAATMANTLCDDPSIRLMILRKRYIQATL
jgi:hypothetical protein